MEEEGVYDVSMESNVICPQLASGVPIGQEDCLFLNIYVPEKVLNHVEKSFNVLVPVMFWIHGGSLLTGSNSFQFYGPKSLMSKEEVIFVTINYRLGPLGFLTMGTDLVPGNAGLRDQNMALNWIHENIVNFRGDPGSVTIFGGSAGSFSVAMHILSPMSKGLFHKAILQSGTALAPSWGPINIERALNTAMLLAEQLGCEPFSLTCLQNQSMNDIINQTFILGMGRHNIAPFWSAVPDLNIVTDENYPPFLPGDAGKLLETGQFNTDIDIIIGTNQDEGIFRFFAQLKDPDLWLDLRDNFETIGPMALFNIANDSEVRPLDVEKMKSLFSFCDVFDYHCCNFCYLDSIGNIDEEHMNGMFKMFTDADFLYGTHKTIQYFLKQNMNVYQYLLTFKSQFSLTQLVGIEPHGVCHGDQNIYEFDPVWGSELPLNNEEMQVRELVTSAFTNFARYGQPSNLSSPSGGLWWWPPLDPKSYKPGIGFFNISGPNSTLGHDDNIAYRMAHWDFVIEL